MNANERNARRVAREIIAEENKPRPGRLFEGLLKNPLGLAILSAYLVPLIFATVWWLS